ncbi:hypothetical protein TKK_0002311 [Trichogramma kaykai]
MAFDVDAQLGSLLSSLFSGENVLVAVTFTSSKPRRLLEPDVSLSLSLNICPKIRFLDFSNSPFVEPHLQEILLCVPNLIELKLINIKILDSVDFSVLPKLRDLVVSWDRDASNLAARLCLPQLRSLVVFNDTNTDSRALDLKGLLDAVGAGVNLIIKNYKLERVCPPWLYTARREKGIITKVSGSDVMFFVKK